MSAYDDAVAYLDAEVHPRCDYDIYSDMRDIVDEMEAESAKLRRERDHWRVEQVHAYSNWEDTHKYAAKLRAENDRLRELCAVMRAKAPVPCRAEGCRDGCPNAALCEREAELVSELGIEVGE